jgi:hypothetical protein
MEKGEIYFNPENSAHLLPLSQAIVRYAAGQISFEEYDQRLNSWWKTHKEAWQESDLISLFLLTSLKK